MASPRHQHCANCIGTLSFPIPIFASCWGSVKSAAIMRAGPDFAVISHSFVGTVQQTSNSTQEVTDVNKK